jgi:Xaa-Pro aminopeptidase
MDPRLLRLLDEASADTLVSADPGLVRMLTGHAGEIAFGPSPFQLPAIVVGGRASAAQLVCATDEAPEGDHVHGYPGFVVTALDPVGGARAALRSALGVAGPGRVLVDAAHVPLALADELPGATEAPAEALTRACAVKTDSEVAAVEAALRLCEAGHVAARSATAEGATELELWSAVTAAVEHAAGGRTTVMADLVSGPRTADVGGAPGTRRLEPSDLVLCDLVPRPDGIWGDSCATWAVETPPPGAEEMHRSCRAALTAGLDALRPGALAGDVDDVVRGAVRGDGFHYPHHTGHGVGFHWHEEPRIVPAGTAVLEPGMVVALEPGAYADGLGVRVECVAVVTEHEARLLSRHPLGLDPLDRGTVA